MKNCSIAKLVLALCAGTAALSSARADIDLQFQWSGSVWESGYSGQYIQSDDAIGIYAFSTAGSTVPAGSPALPSTIYSVCLSPEGLLDGNLHTYNEESIAAASPGIWPSQWVTGRGANGQIQNWGIENAAYLWATFGMRIINGDPALAGNSSEQGCALQFAIWNVLYNSTAYGNTTGFSGQGTAYSSPFSQFDAAEQQDYNAYLTALLHAGPNMPLYTGDILEGTTATSDGGQLGDGQEFFLLGEPTPEPSTVVTGALMLLPLGASALRKFRKTQPSSSSQ